jgi:hypothetical protein
VVEGAREVKPPAKAKKSLADKLAGQAQELDMDADCMADPMAFDEPDFDNLDGGCPSIAVEPSEPLFPGDTGLPRPDPFHSKQTQNQGDANKQGPTGIPNGPSQCSPQVPPMPLQSSLMSLPAVREESSGGQGSAASKKDSLKYSQSTSSNLKSDDNLKETRLKILQNDIQRH